MGQGLSEKWISWPMGGAHSCVRLCPASMSSSGARRPPALFPRARHGHVRPPPARVVVHRASLALFISFWLPFAVGHEGERGDAQGGDAGGGRRRAQGDGARRTKTSAGKTARRGVTRGTVSHTNAPPRRPSRLTDCPVLPTLLRAACPAGTGTGRSGGVVFRHPPSFCPYKKSTI